MKHLLARPYLGLRKTLRLVYMGSVTTCGILHTGACRTHANEKVMHTNHGHDSKNMKLLLQRETKGELCCTSTRWCATWNRVVVKAVSNQEFSSKDYNAVMSYSSLQKLVNNTFDTGTELLNIQLTAPTYRYVNCHRSCIALIIIVKTALHWSRQVKHHSTEN